jgi:hypothetical protein
LRLDETRDRELVVSTFKQLDVKEFDADPKILTGIWIIGPPSHEDLEVIRELAQSLRPTGAIVVAAAAEDEWLEAMIKVSAFPLQTSTDGRKILDDNFIAAVVFVGLFRSPAEEDKRTRERGQVGPLVDACRAGKDCYVVLSPTDKVDWRRYLSRTAESRRAVDEAKNTKRMLYASIPGKDAYTHDFSSFFKAVRARDPKFPGSVEKRFCRPFGAPISFPSTQPSRAGLLSPAPLGRRRRNVPARRAGPGSCVAVGWCAGGF